MVGISEQAFRRRVRRSWVVERLFYVEANAMRGGGRAVVVGGFRRAKM